MLERSPRGLSMVLENQDVLEAAVFLQIQDTVAKGPQNIFDSLGRQRREAGIMIRRFNDDFVSADAVHLVEHAFGLAIQIAFDSQGREFVGNDAYGPARRIALRRRTSIRIRPIGLNLRRSLGLVSIAEGAEATLDAHPFAGKIRGTLGAIGGDDHPTANNGIFS